jgi:hypothetical protein
VSFSQSRTLLRTMTNSKHPEIVPSRAGVLLDGPSVGCISGKRAGEAERRIQCDILSSSNRWSGYLSPIVARCCEAIVGPSDGNEERREQQALADE